MDSYVDRMIEDTRKRIQAEHESRLRRARALQQRFDRDAARTETEAQWNLYHAFREAFWKRPGVRIAIETRAGYGRRTEMFVHMREELSDGRVFAADFNTEPAAAGTEGDFTVQLAAASFERQWAAAVDS